MPRLLPHPDFPCAAITYAESNAVRRNGAELRLSYVLKGAITAIILPQRRAPARADDLWRHTCFEAFVRAEGDSYCEFNLSPSTEWAAWRFDGYRKGMRPLEGFDPPGIEVREGEGAFELSATLDLAGLLPVEATWRVGLSAVVEAARGGLSYWALAHPPGRPDFHHPDCFALELPATGRP